MMNTFKLFIIVTGFSIIFLNSCKSPSEIDGPDKKVSISNRIKPNQTGVIFIVNGDPKYFKLADGANMEFDTMRIKPCVWMDMTFESNIKKTYYTNGMCIEGFTIKLDSLPFTNLDEYKLASPESGSETNFIIRTSGDDRLDTLTSGTDENISGVSFTFNSQRKEIIAFIDSKLIYKIKQLTDTTVFKATLTFQY